MSEWASVLSTTTPERLSLHHTAVSHTTITSMEPSTAQETLAKKQNAKLKQRQTPLPRISGNTEMATAGETGQDPTAAMNDVTRPRQPASLADATTTEMNAMFAIDPLLTRPNRAADEVLEAASTHSTDPATESSQLLTPTMSPRTSSSTLRLQDQSRPFTPSTVHNATLTSEPPRTSAYLTISTQARPFVTEILRPTTTFSVSTTTSANSMLETPLEQDLSTRNLRGLNDTLGASVRHDASVLPTTTTSNGDTEEAARRVSPQKRSRLGTEGGKEDGADGADGSNNKPHKRSKTSTKIEIKYDENGTPRLEYMRALPLNETASPPAIGAPTIPTPLPVAPQGPLSAPAAMVPTPTTSESVTPKTATQSSVQPQKKFSLLGAIIEDSSLIITLVSCLDIPSLISWYAIDKKFHWYYNKNYTAFILASVRTWAPGADKIFPWRHYESLCVKDPVKRQKAKADPLGPDVARMNLFSRDVPSMRWLQMVVWREGVVKDMIIQLATRGLRTPRGTRDAMKRMWFIMDLPMNAHRLACFQSKTFITDQTLRLATHFFLKVDVFFTDPGYFCYPFNHPNQAVWPNHWAYGMALGCNLREKLLAEKSLTALWRVIRGWAPDDTGNSMPIELIDILKLWMRHKFRFGPNTPEDVDRTQPIMGLRMEHFCQTGYQKFVQPKNGAPFKPEPILAPDLLVMGEAIRRRMDLQRKWLHMMAWGFLGPSGKNLRAQTEEAILKAEGSYWTPQEKQIIARNEARERKRWEAARVAKAEEIEADIGE